MDKIGTLKVISLRTLGYFFVIFHLIIKKNIGYWLSATKNKNTATLIKFLPIRREM